MKILGYILTLPIRIFLTVIWFCFVHTLGLLWIVAALCADDSLPEILEGFVNVYIDIW